MNYQRLADKGVRYMVGAGNNWHLRFNKLLSGWNNARGSRKERFYIILRELDDRKENLAKQIYKQEALIEAQKQEEGDMYVMLECDYCNFHIPAKSGGIGVRFRQYSPGALKCSTCGGVMRPKDEELLDFEIKRLLSSTIKRS